MRSELAVIVCTHNPRTDYFSQALAGLKAQTLAADLWTLLVIDNRSDEPVAPRFDFAPWGERARVIREETLGLTPARLRGIREADAELLVFVDDDNVLDPDYLDTALAIAGSKPFVGAWSGQCLPRFETPPPEWTRRYWGNLCIRQFETDVWSNLPRLPSTMPAGAGLCVREPAARRYLALHDEGARGVQLDRTGGSLISGGDQDLAACACDLGLGVGLFAALRLQHLIPPQRLELSYLERLSEGIGFSATLLDSYWGLPAPMRTPVGRAIDLLRAWRQRDPHRRILRAAYRGRDKAARMLAGEPL